MKAGYAALSLTFFMAGCSACAERRPTKAVQSLDGRQKTGCAKEALAPELRGDQSAQFRLSNFLNKCVRDETGKEIARLDDLAVGANGRVTSVTLIPISGNGAKITIPFERLKIVERSGALYFETDVVHNPETAPTTTGTKEDVSSKSAKPGQISDGEAPKEPENKQQ